MRYNLGMAKINPKTATKYHGGIPKEYIEHCKKGGAVSQFCLKYEVCRATFDNWCANYPTMMEAKLIGKHLAEGWWVTQAQNHLIIHNEQDCGTTKFDTTLYKFIMSGRFGHTTDRDFDNRLKELEEKLAKQAQTTAVSQYAQEGEYTLDDDSKTK